MTKEERDEIPTRPVVPTWESIPNSIERVEKANLRDLDRRIHEPVLVRGYIRKRGAWTDELKAKWKKKKEARADTAGPKDLGKEANK